MTARDDARPPVPAWVPVAFVALVVAIAAVVGWRVWAGHEAPPATVAAGDEGAVVAIVPDPLSVPDDAVVLVFGDSWTYGSAADSPSQGYAYVLSELTGWTTVVNGVRASGYLRPGIDGPDFGTRIAALDPALHPDLVIVQGSINDRKLPAEGYREAVDAAWDRLQAVYPDTQIVILGPAPQVLPVEKATARIDADLAQAAGERGWWYVSPVQENWITDDNYLQVIDTSRRGNDHPSTAGHRYLAERVAAAIDALSE